MAIFAPALAATIAALVEIFKVPIISPPVPHVSTASSEELIFIDLARIDIAAPRISSFDSFFIFKAIKIPAISISDISPLIIELKIKLDSSTERSTRLNIFFFI